MNIYTGIKVENSNVYESVKLGEQQRQQFEASWSGGFYNVIKKEVRTMKSGKKCSKSGEVEFFNTELIYSRAMCLLTIGKITLEDVLKYELSPILLFLIENTGEMRALKSKVDLEKALQVDTSLRLQPKPNVVIIDGFAQLWALSQPTSSTVQDLGEALHHLVLPYLAANTDQYLVFDRYYKCSTKGLTRAQRTASIASNHVLSLSTSIPSREDTMLSTGNKVQISDIISKYLIKKLENTTYRCKFVVTFLEDILVHIQNDVVSKKADLKSLHQEADINIIKQCMACVKDEVNCVKVIYDDTDLFVMLTVFVFWQGCKLKVLMETFNTSRFLVDINETAKKHAKTVPSLIGAHALSGCDSVPKLCGIGKKTVIKHLKDQNL